MDTRTNETFWLISNGVDTSYPSLKTDVETEILIVGGGITGALLSYKLIKEGYRVVLVDKRDVCNGSTAASTAMLQYEIDVPLHELIKKRGEACAVASYRNCEKSIFTLQEIVQEIKSECDFELKKSVYFSTNEKDLKFLSKEYEVRKKHGFAVRWMEAAELWEMGLDAFGAIESASGATMDPYKFSNDLLKKCKEMGLAIYDRTEITEVKEEMGKLKCQTNRDHVITAKHILYCTGYESVAHLEKRVVSLKSTYALASEAYDELPAAFKDTIFWNTSKPYLYFRSTRDNRIVMGGGDENFKNAKARDLLLSKKEKSLSDAFSECFPNIPFEADYSWAGTFGETKDGLPYMGKPHKDKNVHYVLGFGGNGITFSVMGMEAILNSIKNQDHPFLEYYRFDR
jgi:glycine/D-amino acid oxidase-like deaminating enzyme